MELATLRFDTYKAITLLKEQGFTKKQSEGIIKVIQDVTFSGVATKQDIQDIKQDIQDLRKEFDEKLTKGFSDMLKFQLIQTIGIIGVMVALFQVF